MHNTYLAFLRGINVGGHHKVPMAELRKEMESLGYDNVKTLLNSGNVIFQTQETGEGNIEHQLSEHLANVFGFPIPTIVRKSEEILSLLSKNPFQAIELTQDLRFYISFLKRNVDPDLQLPWTSEDSSYRILEKRGNIIASVLDISQGKTPKAMLVLERMYGKDITTRNWNTIERIGQMLTE